MSTASPSVLIIGGGPAGSACAIALAQQGIRGLLVEKAEFPRQKVCGCCIGAAGLAALDSLGARQAVRSLGVGLKHWVGVFDGKRVELNLPDGLVVSRTALDPCLLDIARNLGVEVRHGVAAQVNAVDGGGVDVSFSDSTQFPESTRAEQRFDFVVAAAGLSGMQLTRFLPWQESPSGPFGVSIAARDNDHVPPGTLYMVCDNLGYVGIVRLADGTIDIAAALRSKAADSGANLCDRLNQMLDRSGLAFGAIAGSSDVLTTPSLRRKRVPGNGRLIAIGDAAGYVEPFTGEGMTWAMQSGLSAARALAEVTEANRLGSRWCLEVDRLRRRQRICQWLARRLENEHHRFWAARLLNTFPALAHPLINQLNRAA